MRSCVHVRVYEWGDRMLVGMRKVLFFLLLFLLMIILELVFGYFFEWFIWKIQHPMEIILAEKSIDFHICIHTYRGTSEPICMFALQSRTTHKWSQKLQLTQNSIRLWHLLSFPTFISIFPKKCQRRISINLMLHLENAHLSTYA